MISTVDGKNDTPEFCETNMQRWLAGEGCSGLEKI